MDWQSTSFESVPHDLAGHRGPTRSIHILHVQTAEPSPMPASTHTIDDDEHRHPLSQGCVQARPRADGRRASSAVDVLETVQAR